MPVELHQPTKLPKRTKDPKTISTRAASVGQGKNEAPLVPKPSSGVEIQCMRMRKLLAAKALDTPPVVISTVEVLESYLTNKTQSKIIIRIRFFLWISYHCYEPWKLVRLHVVDADSPESLEELLQVFQVSYKENSSEIDFMLLTARVGEMPARIQAELHFASSRGPRIHLEENTAKDDRKAGLHQLYVCGAATLAGDRSGNLANLQD
ncbi:hypothetical protein PC119_g16153 [Phytophthora cactorum]|uniref:Uncharacterized protein n=1 Tax=Phytophthora cactorum TaxID=29920 RepID=A0A8T1CLV2_9STRA|nr:hypothetical protein PC117_g15410 [Phytophthora cactorum]KAG3002999.1 hypothetical protein PC119_g16153 [Phytophthora cactorum]